MTDEVAGLFERASDLLAVTDLEGVVRAANPAFRETVAWGEVARARWIDHVLHPGAPWVSFTDRHVARDGRELWLEWVAVIDREGGVVHAAGRDVSQRRTAEERYRLILDRALEAFIAMDVDGQVIEWNAQAEATFGWSRAEALGRKLIELIIPPAYHLAHEQGLARYLETGKGPLLDRRIEVSGRHRDGREIPLELWISALRVGEIITFNAFLSDITERQQTNERNIQTAKLASLGEMVAGVAHEINNPLSFVSNNVVVLERGLKEVRRALDAYRAAAAPPEDIDQDELDHVLKSLDRLFGRTRDGLKRIQGIVLDLRGFARLDEAEVFDADLNEGILSTVNIVRGRAKAAGVVDLELDLEPLPRLHCHAARINQVVMNLLSNAIDASPPGGIIRVRTRAAAGAITIEVLDQGEGVRPEIARKIFDPFFTTKPPGAGTGLGLSISYGIVNDHGGSIGVETAPGGGARFIVTLPLRR